MAELDALGERATLAQLDAMTARMRAELTDVASSAAEAVDPPVSAAAVWARWTALRRRVEARELLTREDPLAAAVNAKRADVVAHLGTDQAFAAALEQAGAQLALPSESTDPSWFAALATLVSSPARRRAALELLGPSLRRLLEARLAGGGLVNSVALGGLARALLSLEAREHLETLVAAMDFCTGKRCHHEARQEAGWVAMALTAAGDADVARVDAALSAFLARWAETYDGHRFVMQTRYARWLLAGHGAEARAYLADPGRVRGLAFVAAAVADLDDKQAIPVLEARRPHLHNPVADEAFAEALARLGRQAGPPPASERMMWLFGVRSPMELALGDDSDDQLLARARARLGRPDLGYRTETDDTAPAEQERA